MQYSKHCRILNRIGMQQGWSCPDPLPACTAPAVDAGLSVESLSKRMVGPFCATSGLRRLVAGISIRTSSITSTQQANRLPLSSSFSPQKLISEFSGGDTAAASDSEILTMHLPQRRLPPQSARKKIPAAIRASSNVRPCSTRIILSSGVSRISCFLSFSY